MLKDIKQNFMKYGITVGTLAGLTLASISHAAVDTDVMTPLQAFIDYAKENILGALGIVILGVGAIYALTLGIKAAMAWFRRAVR